MYRIFLKLHIWTSFESYLFVLLLLQFDSSFGAFSLFISLHPSDTKRLPKQVAVISSPEGTRWIILWLLVIIILPLEGHWPKQVAVIPSPSGNSVELKGFIPVERVFPFLMPELYVLASKSTLDWNMVWPPVLGGQTIPDLYDSRAFLNQFLILIFYAIYVNFK